VTTASGSSALGKAVDGQRLLALFGLIMIAVGLSMLRLPSTSANEAVRLTKDSVGHVLPRRIGIGFAVGWRRPRATPPPGWSTGRLRPLSSAAVPPAALLDRG
jgi:hypothetical protein